LHRYGLESLRVTLPLGDTSTAAGVAPLLTPGDTFYMSSQRHQYVNFLTPRTESRRIAGADPRRRVSFAAVLCLSLCLPWAALASDWQQLDSIEQAAERHVNASHKVATGSRRVRATPLDDRLKLKQCPQALHTEQRRGKTNGRHVMVRVSCSGPTPWKVYVAVDVIVSGNVFVARRSLPRGHLLSRDDLGHEMRDISRLSGGYILETTEITGQILKRPVLAGSIITPSVLEAETVIRRGQSVTLQVNTGDISIRMAGKAMADGALNQRIKVENSVSRRIVEGLARH
jgi:flagella basal body P-ring formation protein FlgA